MRKYLFGEENSSDHFFLTIEEATKARNQGAGFRFIKHDQEGHVYLETEKYTEEQIAEYFGNL